MTNSSNLTWAVDAPLYLEEHYGWMMVAALVIGAAAVLGTLGNMLIILSICCVRALRTCGNVFILNLALADLIVTVLIDPFNVVGAVAGRKILMADYTLCDYIAAFCGPSCVSSMWNMCAISINRYFYICKPHLYPRIFTFKTSIIYCAGIWLLAHLLHMPNHIGWGEDRFSREYYICTFDTITYAYDVFYIVTGVIIPLNGVLFGYAAIFFRVREVKQHIRNYKLANQLERNGKAVLAAAKDPVFTVGEPEKMEIVVPRIRLQMPSFTRDDVKMVKTLFAAFFVFLGSWFLLVCFNLSGNPTSIPGWLYVVAMILAHGNSAVNPFLYSFTNEKFRDGYRAVLCMNRSRSSAIAGLVERDNIQSQKMAATGGSIAVSGPSSTLVVSKP
ncbi:putative Melatonin receptor type 1A [Hypsibius exemplaris]|uniref:Melatonin receptor type 1A n=1 Tax=Hypsibius exemplaris TaxID=2072580 RepID=A0A1W0WQG6_HYPEX|nr:putative Melatonin receptor type 1A [Hypsibius exemplaris]